MPNILNLLLKNHNLVTGRCPYCGRTYLFDGKMIMVDISGLNTKPMITNLQCDECGNKTKKLDKKKSV